MVFACFFSRNLTQFDIVPGQHFREKMLLILVQALIVVVLCF